MSLIRKAFLPVAVATLVLPGCGCGSTHHHDAPVIIHNHTTVVHPTQKVTRHVVVHPPKSKVRTKKH